MSRKTSVEFLSVHAGMIVSKKQKYGSSKDELKNSFKKMNFNNKSLWYLFLIMHACMHTGISHGVTVNGAHTSKRFSK